jgi:hypothetical protein
LVGIIKKRKRKKESFAVEGDYLMKKKSTREEG